MLKWKGSDDPGSPAGNSQPEEQVGSADQPVEQTVLLPGQQVGPVKGPARVAADNVMDLALPESLNASNDKDQAKRHHQDDQQQFDGVNGKMEESGASSVSEMALGPTAGFP